MTTSLLIVAVMIPSAGNYAWVNGLVIFLTVSVVVSFFVILTWGVQAQARADKYEAKRTLVLDDQAEELVQMIHRLFAVPTFLFSAFMRRLTYMDIIHVNKTM